MAVVDGPWRGDSEIVLAGVAEQPGFTGVRRLAVERCRQRIIAVGADDGSIRLLDVRSLSEEPKNTIQSHAHGGSGHMLRIEALAWLPNDDRLLVSGGDTCMKIWDAHDVENCVANVEFRADVRGGTVAERTHMAAAALSDNTVRLVDLRTARITSALQGHTQPPLVVSWSAEDESKLYSGGMDGTIRAWDARMGARSLFCFDPYAHVDDQCVLEPPPPSIDELRRRDRPIFGRSPTEADRARFDSRLKSRFEPYNTRSLEATPHSDIIGVRRPDDAHENHLHEPPRRKYTNEPCCAHWGAIISLAIPLSSRVKNNAGKKNPETLVSVGVDGRARRWNTECGTLVPGNSSVFNVGSWTSEKPFQIAAHGATEDLCFIPEGDLLAAYCLKSGEQVCKFSAHTIGATCAEVLHGCGRVLSGGADGRVLLWRATSGNSAAKAAIPIVDQPVICLD